MSVTVRLLGGLAALAIPLSAFAADAFAVQHSVHHRQKQTTLPTALVKRIVSTLNASNKALKQVKRIATSASNANKTANNALAVAQQALKAAQQGGPAGPAGAAVAGPGAPRRSRADRGAGRGPAQGQDSRLRAVHLAAGDDRLGLGHLGP